MSAYMSRPPPSSCDTFVALGNCSQGNHVIFGKNSDRPGEEVQEVIYRPEINYDANTKLQCTYIEIDQVAHTHAVILSKPSWMWGAEMGANDQNVAIGNEAVWTKLGSDEDNVERLLGMDLVRLGLERSDSAEMAVNVITSLLEEHGQGGPCSDTDPDLIYHNSFLIADTKEAWILETAGKHWAAEQITSGYRNISNALSIGTKIDKMSNGIKELAQEKGWWDGSSDFHFANSYSASGPDGRKECGEKLLAKYSEGGKFGLKSMFNILRNEESGICMSDGYFISTSSQVSVISTGQRPSCHWFTGTPDPQLSVFKPFIFTNNVKISPHIQSPKIADEDDPAKVTPRFAKKVNRTHLLYRRQQAATKNAGSIVDTLRELEKNCVRETETVLENFDPDRLSEMDDLFKDCVDSELKFYK